MDEIEKTHRKFVRHDDAGYVSIKDTVTSMSRMNIWGEYEEPRAALCELLQSFDVLQKRYELEKEPSPCLEERLIFLGYELVKMGVQDLGASNLLDSSEKVSAYIARVQSGAIPDSTLYPMIKRHANDMRRLEKEHTPFFEACKKEFIAKIKEEVERGVFPKEILPRLDRVSRKKIFIADRLSAPRSGIEAHTSTIGAAKVFSDLLDDKTLTRHSLFHEFLHEMSGKGLHIFEEKRPVTSKVTRILGKEGVSLLVKNSGGRFKWLDEAITEYLALHLSEYEEGEYLGSNSYIRERKELQKMLEGGLESKIIIQAYFEDIVESQAPKERGRHFAALAKAVNVSKKESYALNRIENEFWFDENLNSLLRSHFTDARQVDSEAALRGMVPKGTGIFKIHFEFGTKKAVIMRDFYQLLAADYFDKRSGTDKRAVESLQNGLEKELRPYLSKLRWEITPRGRA